MWNKIKPYYPVLKGAAVAGLGALLSYVAHWGTGVDVGPYGPLLAGAATFALDAIHHSVTTGDVPKPPDGPKDPPDDGHGSLSLCG